MKIGEIWQHKNKQKLLESDFDAYEDGDEKVRIQDIDNSNAGQRIFFVHLTTGIFGVLYREHFIQYYKRVYDENR